MRTIITSQRETDRQTGRDENNDYKLEGDRQTDRQTGRDENNDYKLEGDRQTDRPR